MEKVKLGEIAQLITKGTTPTSIGYEFLDKGINFVKIESIKEDGSFCDEKFAYISRECYEKLARSQLKENDILFSIAGAIGKIAIVSKNILPANTNQALAIIRIDKKFDKTFLKFILKSNLIKKQYNKKKQGIAQINLSLKDISELEIPLLDIQTQKNIAKRLIMVQDIINLRKKQIEALDGLTKSLFFEMFGDPLNSNSFGRITLDKLTKVNQGLQIPISKRKLNNGENRYKYITIQYLNGSKKEEYIESPSSTVICNKDDILMTRTGNTGQVITGVEGVFHNNFFKVNYDKTKLNKEFLIKYFEQDSIYADMLRRATTSTIPDLSHSEFYKMSIDLPPIELQNQFAEIVKQIDKQKLETQKSLEQMQNLKESLMNKYFG